MMGNRCAAENLKFITFVWNWRPPVIMQCNYTQLQWRCIITIVGAHNYTHALQLTRPCMTALTTHHDVRIMRNTRAYPLNYSCVSKLNIYFILSGHSARFVKCVVVGHKSTNSVRKPPKNRTYRSSGTHIRMCV